MAHVSDFPSLEILATRQGPVLFHWPMPGNPGALCSFADAHAWQAFVLSLGTHPSLPEIVQAKFRRAQKLYMFGWLDMDVLKSGELAALAALELALRDRYLGKINAACVAAGKQPPRPSLDMFLKHVVHKDGLTNEQLPIYRRTGGNPVARVLGEAKPSLADIRNSLAHGDPFDDAPQSGLLELVRDLINFAYRHWIAEHSRALGAA